MMDLAINTFQSLSNKNSLFSCEEDDTESLKEPYIVQEII